MASEKNVNIKITAESKDAEKGISRVTEAVNKMGKSATVKNIKNLTAAVTQSISAFGSLKSAVENAVVAVNECADAYAKQRAAEIALETAAKNNPYLTDSSVKSLKSYATEMAKLSGIADEQLLPTMAKLATAGRTQDEIMKIVAASIDVAASGAMSFEQACSELNKTFLGEIGSLKELVPEVRSAAASYEGAEKSVKSADGALSQAAKSAQKAAAALSESAGEARKAGGYIEDAGDAAETAGDKMEKAGEAGADALEGAAKSAQKAAAGAEELAEETKGLNEEIGATSSGARLAQAGISRMTAEELKAGKAVDAVAEAFKGMNDAMGGVTGGAERLENAMTSLKEEIGAAFAEPLNAMKSFFASYIEGVAEMLRANRELKDSIKEATRLEELEASGVALTTQQKLTKSEGELAALQEKFEQARAGISAEANAAVGDVWQFVAQSYQAYIEAGTMSLDEALSKATEDRMNTLATVTQSLIAAYDAQAQKSGERTYEGMIKKRVLLQDEIKRLQSALDAETQSLEDNAAAADAGASADDKARASKEAYAAQVAQAIERIKSERATYLDPLDEEDAEELGKIRGLKWGQGFAIGLGEGAEGAEGELTYTLEELKSLQSAMEGALWGMVTDPDSQVTLKNAKFTEEAAALREIAARIKELEGNTDGAESATDAYIRKINEAIEKIKNARLVDPFTGDEDRARIAGLEWGEGFAVGVEEGAEGQLAYTADELETLLAARKEGLSGLLFLGEVDIESEFALSELESIRQYAERLKELEPKVEVEVEPTVEEKAAAAIEAYYARLAELKSEISAQRASGDEISYLQELELYTKEMGDALVDLATKSEGAVTENSAIFKEESARRKQLLAELAELKAAEADVADRNELLVQAYYAQIDAAQESVNAMRDMGKEVSELAEVETILAAMEKGIENMRVQSEGELVDSEAYQSAVEKYKELADLRERLAGSGGDDEAARIAEMVAAYEARIAAVDRNIEITRALGKETDELAAMEQKYAAQFSALISLIENSDGLIGLDSEIFQQEAAKVIALAEEIAAMKADIDTGEAEEKLKALKAAIEGAMPSPAAWRELSDQLLGFVDGIEELRGEIPDEEIAALEAQMDALKEALEEPELEGWEALAKEAEDIWERVAEIELMAKEAAADGKLELEEAYLEEATRLNEEAAKKMEEAQTARAEAVKQKWLEIENQALSAVTQVASIISSACSTLMETAETQLDNTLTKLEIAYLSGEMSEEEYNEAVLKAKKEAAQVEYKIEMWEWTASLLTAAANIAQGVTKAIAQGGTAGLITGALVSAAGAVQLAAIIGSKPVPPTFSTGGIVGGTSYTGDRVQALLNSGEMVLNAGQQRNLFDSINSGNIGTSDARGQGSSTQIVVNNSASNIVSAEPEVTERQINVMIDMRVNNSMKKGRYNQALTQAEQSQSGKWYGS